MCAVETSSCVDCFVLTQDDVRVDGPRRQGQGQAGRQRRPPAVEDSAAATSLPGRGGGGRTALTRSATSVTPSDVTRHKSSLPSVFTPPTADVTAVSTWLDEAQLPDDQLETHQRIYENFAKTKPPPQPVAHLRDVVHQRDDFDFHFGLASSSSQPQSSHVERQPAPAAAASSINSRPVALVQPHKVTGVRVMPNELNASLVAWSQGKQSKPVAPSSGQLPATDTTHQQDDTGSRLNNRVEERPAASLRDQMKAAAASTRESVTPTTFTKPSDFTALNPSTNPVPAPSRPKPQPQPPPAAVTRAVSDQSDATGAQLTSKDKEIASAIGNMKLDYSQNTLSARGTNFEKCLGYFP